MTSYSQQSPATHPEAGQATTEYALILLVAAIIATLVIAWATAGGGAGKIGSLFDSIFEAIVNRASSFF
jgi:Flp pilus assembly pilin Flp